MHASIWLGDVLCLELWPRPVLKCSFQRFGFSRLQVGVFQDLHLPSWEVCIEALLKKFLRSCRKLGTLGMLYSVSTVLLQLLTFGNVANVEVHCILCALPCCKC